MCAASELSSNKDHSQDSNDDDDDRDDNEEEELVYTGAQILAGNLDQKLSSFGKNNTYRDYDYDHDNHNNNDNSECMEDLNDLKEQDVIEQRGRAVLNICSSFAVTGDDNNSCHHHQQQQKNDKKKGKKKKEQDNRENDAVAERALASISSHDGNPLYNNQHEPIWKILRPVLLSMAHVCIANGLVERGLLKHEMNAKQMLYGKARYHLHLALDLWNCNPPALLALANLTRMGVMDDVMEDTYDATVRQRMHQCMRQYMAASKCASFVRSYGMEKLFGECRLESPDELFLIDTIVLGLGAQVDEALEEDENHADDDECHEGGSDDDDKEESESYGPSKVASTASYMAALLASTLGHHDLAREALKVFGKNITRIHPLVWDTAAQMSLHDSGAAVAADNHDDDDDGNDGNQENHVHVSVKEDWNSSNFATVGAFTPSIFREAIPQEMAQILRYAFRPDAPYWEQSGYGRGVYYSFWHDYHEDSSEKANPKDVKKMVVSNVVEDVILSYLLPRVRAVVGEEKLSELAGFEWWVHTRPYGANLGHQLHFDTDEALLEQDEVVSFPICATVLYLNGEDPGGGNDRDHHKFGATVLFDQTPYSKKNAECAWISSPRARSFLVFPGDLLHGVLPCAPPGISSVQINTKTNHKRKYPYESVAVDRDPSSNKKSVSKIIPTQEQPHRLTFMVNFWARNIPEKLKKRKLYGPSGPLPPTTRQHSWTHDLLHDGTYPLCKNTYTTTATRTEVGNGLQMEQLVCVKPAWELLQEDHCGVSDDEKKKSSKKGTLSLDLPPSGINQRFFVKNAPDFFHSTLFEK